MEKKFFVGEKIQRRAGVNTILAEIISRTENSITYRETIIGDNSLSATIKTADIIRVPIWDEEFENQIGIKESFICWGSYDDDSEDVCYGNVYNYCYPS